MGQIFAYSAANVTDALAQSQGEHYAFVRTRLHFIKNKFVSHDFSFRVFRGCLWKTQASSGIGSTG